MKKLFTLLLAAVASLGTTIASVQIDGIAYNLDNTNLTAEEPCLMASGTCGAQGDNLTWELSCDSVLTISGTGAMANYTSSYALPWYNYSSAIRQVVVSNGVSCIGEYAFCLCSHLETVQLGQDVKSIERYAFGFCYKLTSINIPNKLSSIGYNAFGYCNTLSFIELPNSLERIESYAFVNCTNLRSITIPENVISIGDWALINCDSLRSINVSINNLHYCSIDGVLFDKEVSTIIQCPGNKQGSYTIPNSVTKIGNGAFSGCSRLTEINIPNGITDIGSNAFISCSALSSIHLPSGVKFMGIGALSECIGFTHVELPSGITKISECLFCGCTGLLSINISDNITAIEAGAFNRCYRLSSMYIGRNVTNIGDIALGGCLALDTIVCKAAIPPTLGENVFWGVGKSTPLYVPAESIELYKSADQWKDFTNILSIGEELVAHQIDSITVEQAITYGNLFSANEESVKTYAVIGYVTQIEKYNTDNSINFWMADDKNNTDFSSYGGAFYVWRGVSDTEFEVGDKVCVTTKIKNYGNRVIESQRGVVTLLQEKETSTEPCLIDAGYCGAAGDTLTWELSCDSVLTISGTGAMPDYTFGNAPWYSYNKYIRNIIIDNGVTYIGRHAFNLSQAVTMTLSKTVSYINFEALYQCSALMSILVAADNPYFCSIDGVLFNKQATRIVKYPMGRKGEYIIPDHVTHIGGDAFYQCVDLTSVVFPEGIKTIDSWAFAESGISSAYLPNSLDSIYEDAFRACRQLTAVHISKGVRFISIQVFNACWKLDTMVVDKENPVFDSRDNCNAIIKTSANALVCGCNKTVIPNSVTAIGFLAFEERRLQSFIIPKNITNIYTEAFSMSQLTELTCLAETPPVLGDEVFYRVNKSIPFHVPEESVELYKSADQWKDFTNILPIEKEWDPEDPVNPGYYKVRLLVNDETMGSVIGEGFYPQGAEVTISAIPAEGCRFVRWSDGNTNAVRTITLTVDTTFTAYFEHNYFSLTLETATEPIAGRWFAFGVPFDVFVSTGIFIVGTENPARYNYDFVIDEYDGALRANTQNGWKRVAANDTLKRGHFYMIAPKAAKEWRFESAYSGIFIEPNNSIAVKAYPSAYGEHHAGWNGIANPQWTSATALLEGVTYATVYNNYYGVYSTELLSEKVWSMAEPFFVQTPTDGEVVFYTENVTSPSTAPMRMEFSSDKAVAYTLELADVFSDYTDKAYISTLDGKEDRYMIGHDLEKMQVNNAAVPQLWLEAYGIRLAAYEMPLDGAGADIPIGLYAPQEGSYTLTINDVPDETTIYLTKNNQPLWNMSVGACTLTLEQGENEGYGLSINAPLAIPVLEDASENIRKMVINGQILILRGDKTYTVTGQEVK